MVESKGNNENQSDEDWGSAPEGSDDGWGSNED
jgi:hypothetical protein